MKNVPAVLRAGIALQWLALGACSGEGSSLELPSAQTVAGANGGGAGAAASGAGAAAGASGAAAGASGLAGAGAAGSGAAGEGASGAGSAGSGGTAGSAGSGGMSGAAGAGGAGGDASSLPPVSDYAAPGPFADAAITQGVGPNNNYTLFRPMGSLGRDGFKHPIAAWGNGISTTPDQYQSTLTRIATHGFVIIACNDTQAERPCLSDGLDWLIAQDAAAGELQGKLDTSTELTIGYSWGGGAAIDTANRPNVKATVSLHGMPPRGDTAFDDMHAPLLLFTSTGDTFVNAEGYVTPNYDASQVQTFYATLQESVGHLYILDETAVSCAASVLLGGPCAAADKERAPTIAWLRMWAYGDRDARAFFYGDDCTLCASPWTYQRKNWID